MDLYSKHMTPTQKQEQSIAQTIRKIVGSDVEANYIIWKYAPELLPCDKVPQTYEELQKIYKAFEDKPQKFFDRLLYKEDVQQATKWLMKRLECKRDVDLLNKFYKLAMSGDVQALKAYTEYKKNFFTDDEENELRAILRGASLKSSSSDDDFIMEI